MAAIQESPEIIAADMDRRLPSETAVLYGAHDDLVRHGGILAVDLYESAEEYVVTTMIPGVARKGVVVSCAAHSLTLVALIPDPVASDCGGGIWRIRELGNGPFARWLPLASAIVPERVQTQLTDGRLTVRLPKVERQPDQTDRPRSPVMRERDT